MGKILLCLLAALWLSASIAGQSLSPGQPKAGYAAKVIRIADGDTITVQTDDFEQIRVRLYGIDAPESNQPGGAEATAALKPLQGQTVTIQEMDEPLRPHGSPGRARGPVDQPGPGGPRSCLALYPVL